MQRTSDIRPSPTNHPPCGECTHDNVYGHGFEMDLRNRCEACLKRRKSATMIWRGSMGLLGFEREWLDVGRLFSPRGMWQVQVVGGIKYKRIHIGVPNGELPNLRAQ
jgi:hypothetical protein